MSALPRRGARSALRSGWRSGIVGRRRAAAGILVLAVFGPALAGYDPQFVDLEQRFVRPFSAHYMCSAPISSGAICSRACCMDCAGRYRLRCARRCWHSSSGTVLGLLAAAVIPLRQSHSAGDGIRAVVSSVRARREPGGGGRQRLQAIVLILGLVTWPVFCRVVQAEAASLFTREYVLAAEMLQMSSVRLYLRHVLPGLLSSLSVLVPFHFADMLIAESALSFLGVGAPLGSPTWGNMLQESRSYLTNAPWLMLVPASRSSRW